MTDIDILKNDIEKRSQVFNQIKIELKDTIIGQDNLIEKLLIAFLCDGHILLEGVLIFSKNFNN